MATHKILIVATSNERIGDSPKPTGLWLEELAAPYFVFADAGFDITVASVRGGQVPIDPRSETTVGDNPESVDRFLQDAIAVAKITNTPALADLDPNAYDAIFLAGGHGTMWDFPQCEALARAVTATLQQGRVVAAVCHGPAGLVSATWQDGTPLVKGRTMAAFTNSEEDAVGLQSAVPFLLENRLRELGAVVEQGENFAVFAVTDGDLITGQNPASSTKVAELVLERLRQAA